MGIGWIGALSGALGGAFGTQAKQDSMIGQQKDVKQQLNDVQAYHDRRYNEDATQRADAQRLLAMTMRAIENRNRAAAGTAAVMGGTEESVAAARAANAQAYSDTASQIAADAANRKDKIDEQTQQRKEALNNTLRELKAETPGTLDMLSNIVGGAAKGFGAGMGLG